MIARRLAGAIAGLLLAGTPAIATAALDDAPARADTCAGVWVVVDFGDLGAGVRTECAAAHGTGREALTSAGFEADFRADLLYRIDGLPKDGVLRADHYWSYWQAAPTTGGGWSEWTYSNLGAAGTRPQQGHAEGWRFTTTDKAIPPQASLPRSEPAGTSPSSGAPATSTATTAPAPDGGQDPPIGVIATGVILAAGGAALVVWRVRKGSPH